MTTNACGAGAAVMTLKPPKFRPGEAIRDQAPPGGLMRPKSWKVVGAVIAIPAEFKRWIGMGEQGPYDGLLFVGPLAGYVGLMKEAKTEPFTAKFPASRYGRTRLSDKVWKWLIRAYWQGEPDKDVLNREVPCFVEGQFLTGSVISLARTIWPISIEKDDNLWGIQFCKATKKKNRRPGKTQYIHQLAAALDEVNVKPSELIRMKRCYMPARAFAVSAGWRCWVVAGVTREGNAKELIEEWVEEVPERYRAFRRVFFAGDFIGED